jgi:hypothetical protein
MAAPRLFLCVNGPNAPNDPFSVPPPPSHPRQNMFFSVSLWSKCSKEGSFAVLNLLSKKEKITESWKYPPNKINITVADKTERRDMKKIPRPDEMTEEREKKWRV